MDVQQYEPRDGLCGNGHNRFGHHYARTSYRYGFDRKHHEQRSDYNRLAIKLRKLSLLAADTCLVIWFWS